jgi:hypothetical protein
MNDDKINNKAFEIFNKVKIHFDMLTESGEFSIEEKHAVTCNFISNMFMSCCIYYNNDKSINLNNSTHNFIYLQECMIDHFKRFISRRAD